MPSKEKGYALITGATSGIGFELCKLFAQEGYHLVIVARSEKRLAETAQQVSMNYRVKVYPLKKDLFDPSAPAEIYEELKKSGFKITALVNNAGQGEYGSFSQNELGRELDIIQLNITTPVSLTKFFLQDMLVRGEGKILQVSSQQVKFAAPMQAVYNGTKCFIHSFSKSLAKELVNTNITITTLMPGITDTDFYHKAGEEQAFLARKIKPEDPALVAREGFRALMKGKREAVAGNSNKVENFLERIIRKTKKATNTILLKDPASRLRVKPSSHGPSRQERKMIEAAEHTYEGRDLASNSNSRVIEGKP